MIEKEELLLKKRMMELAGNCYQRDIPSNTEFLTLSEQTIFHSLHRELPPVKYILTGGCEMAERKIVCFLPSYEEPETASLPIRVLKAGPAAPRFAEDLTHRDYLGALMNLGIERSLIGDILMQDRGCLIFCLDKIAGYIAEQFSQVRHTPIRCAFADPAEAEVSLSYEEVSGSVASPRLDSIVSMVFRTSRAKILPLIEGEKVFIDGRLAQSPSAQLKGGERVSVRGLGKFLYVGVENETKKGRMFVSARKYK